MTALCMVTPHVSVLPCTIKHATCRQTPHNGGNTPCSDHVHTPHRQSLYTLHTASLRTRSTPRVCVHTPHRQSLYTLHTVSPCTHSTPPVPVHKTPECIPTKLLSVTYRTFAGPFCLCEKADVFHIYLPSHLLRSSFRPLLGVQVPLILTSFNSSVC